MKKLNIIKMAVLGFALITMGFQCEKDFIRSIPAYEYAEKLTLTPYKKSYSINDTIWVQFQSSDKTLFDKLTARRVSTDTTQLLVGFTLRQNYPAGNTVELFSAVKVENAIDVLFGPLSVTNNDLSFKTDCTNSNYFFRAGFVPKKIGIYTLSPRCEVSPCPNKVNSPNSLFTFTFDLADCNKDIWLSIPPASRSGETGYTDVSIDKKELFVFKVE